jgi:hypothetical protein
LNGTGGSYCLVAGAEGIRTAGLIRLKVKFIEHRSRFVCQRKLGDDPGRDFGLATPARLMPPRLRAEESQGNGSSLSAAVVPRAFWIELDLAVMLISYAERSVARPGLTLLAARSAEQFFSGHYCRAIAHEMVAPGRACGALTGLVPESTAKIRLR